MCAWYMRVFYIKGDLLNSTEINFFTNHYTHIPLL